MRSCVLHTDDGSSVASAATRCASSSDSRRTRHKAAAVRPADVGLGAPAPAQRGWVPQALHRRMPHRARAVQRGAQRDLRPQAPGRCVSHPGTAPAAATRPANVGPWCTRVGTRRPGVVGPAAVGCHAVPMLFGAEHHPICICVWHALVTNQDMHCIWTVWPDSVQFTASRASGCLSMTLRTLWLHISNQPAEPSFASIASKLSHWHTLCG